MHMIDETTGRAAIAYAGETPWHGLGKQLTAGADIDTWTREAGLAYTVKRAGVEFNNGTELAPFRGRSVLYRDDTLAPLSVVGDGYNVVQPAEVMAFFDKLVAHNGFTMEVAGALDGGKRVWGLARVSDGAPILSDDVVRPYVLLATSYDGTMATTAKFTAIRVVCHNTLTMSVGAFDAAAGKRIAGEADTERTCIRVPHSAKFDANEVRVDLGIVFDAWEQFLCTSRRLARTKVDRAFATQLLKTLLPLPTKTVNGAVQQLPIEDSRAYKAIMALFEGGAIGADLPEANGTAFGLLNAVTEYVDHHRGRDATRLSQAWFGAGEGLKNEAARILTEVTA